MESKRGQKKNKDKKSIAPILPDTHSIRLRCVRVVELREEEEGQTTAHMRSRFQKPTCTLHPSNNVGPTK